ncbi:MAG: Holo-[acyl-carrier-protein] synthase [Chlamydiae bacterium]|nr:Holo-[acyl-carrier-protein] synthase [Chlamydiota bacterium]
MPIKGLGNDIIEISRIQRLIDRYGQKFLDRTFTEKEQSYCLKYRESSGRFAGRFAAKEAISKALGTGFRDEVSMRAIEIQSGQNGEPVVVLSEEIRERFGEVQVMLTISHCKEYATAVAIVI